MKPALRGKGARAAVGRGSWLLRLLLPAGLLLFALLLFNAARQLDWQEVVRALSSYPSRQIALGVGLSLLTCTAASAYELASRAHVRHGVAWPDCLGIGFVAYSIAVSLSALLGNWGARYRLYAQRGLSLRKTTQIAVCSISAHWSGFVLLAGLLFLLVPPALPAHWPLGQLALRIAGAGLLAAVLGYLWLCHRRRGRTATIRGLHFSLPSPAIALWQLLLSALVWCGLSLVIANFLPAQVPYLLVVGTLCLSTLSTLVIRLPAGLGVTEVVFVAVLGARLGAPVVVAALLAYRVAFQLLPVLLGAGIYLLLELRGRRSTAMAAALTP